MDITTVFGTVVPGSSPGGCTKRHPMSISISKSKVPQEVSRVTKSLQDAGFESYLVGGCVRDMLLDKKPKDWDVTTNATPEQIQNIFEHTFYENTYGTVGVVNDEFSDETLEVIEVTPYRTESEYTDKRRPDKVEFSDSLEDDLKRRDFTVNAIAFDDQNEALVDPYSGMTDLENGILKTVGEPDERFNEDALRLFRAVRIATEHELTIEDATKKSVALNSSLLEHVAKERIRDEVTRVTLSPHPKRAFEMCRELGLIPHIIPELEELYDIDQKGAHKYDVWEHSILSLQAAADRDFPFHVRLSAFFHDIGKPRTRRPGKKKAFTFYGHEVVGARMVKKIMEDLKYSKEEVSRVTSLVRWHMFFSDPDLITKTAVRRLLRNVGEKSIWDLINLRICDRAGTGLPKDEPYRLRKYEAMIEEVLTDPVSVGQLKIDGDILIAELHMKPGPHMGYILHALLEEVLVDPTLNTEEYLKNRSMELSKLPENELKELGTKGKVALEEAETAQKKEIRSKYKVN